MHISHVHLAAQGGGGGGFKTLLSEAEPETECYRNIYLYCVGLEHNDGVFLCTLNFYLAAQGGGGGV